MGFKSSALISICGLAGLTACVQPPQSPLIPAADSRPAITASSNGSVITVHNTYAVVNGHSVRLAFTHPKQNPDCSLSESGLPVFKIVTEPAHGSITQSSVDDFPVYSATNPLAKCNVRLPGIEYTYTPQPGYYGPDQLTYQFFTTTGQEMVINTTVNVAAP